MQSLTNNSMILALVTRVQWICFCFNNFPKKWLLLLVQVQETSHERGNGNFELSNDTSAFHLNPKNKEWSLLSMCVCIKHQYILWWLALSIVNYSSFLTLLFTLNISYSNSTSSLLLFKVKSLERADWLSLLDPKSFEIRVFQDHWLTDWAWQLLTTELTTTNNNTHIEDFFLTQNSEQHKYSTANHSSTNQIKSNRIKSNSSNLSTMISPRSIALAVTIAVFFASSSDAFSVLPSSSSHSAAISTPTSLNMFGDALKGAFGNDDSLGKAKDAGLSNVSFIS